ncbi:hypothetical protein EB118_12655 [bacterium]|nr:hypothetical protein [bacterium]
MPTSLELKRQREQKSSKPATPQKTPQQLREDALYNAETRRLAQDAEMPQLEDYMGISTLADGGQLTARTLSGEDITKQMEQSPWYRMAGEKQSAEQARLMDQAARQQAGATAGAG